MRKGRSARLAGEGDDSSLHCAHGGILLEEQKVLRLQRRRAAVFRRLGSSAAGQDPSLRRQRLRTVPVLRTDQRQEEHGHHHRSSRHILCRPIGASLTPLLGEVPRDDGLHGRSCHRFL